MEWLILGLIVLWAVVAVIWMRRRKKAGKSAAGDAQDVVAVNIKRISNGSGLRAALFLQGENHSALKKGKTDKRLFAH